MQRPLSFALPLAVPLILLAACAGVEKGAQATPDSAAATPVAAGMKIDEFDRSEFWAQVDNQDSIRPCWEWRGLISEGRPRFTLQGKRLRGGFVDVTFAVLVFEDMIAILPSWPILSISAWAQSSPAFWLSVARKDW